MPKEVAAGFLLHDSTADLYLICHATQSAEAETLDDQCWSIPKGLVADGEQLLETASRELKEETGIAITDLVTELGITEPHVTLPGKKKAIHVFRVSTGHLSQRFPAETLKCTSFIDPPSKLQGLPEVDGYRWVTLDDASKMVANNMKALFSDATSNGSAPSSPVGSGASRKILFLHAWGQSAGTFEKRTKVLKKKLQKAGLDVVYAQAPHTIPAFSADETEPSGWWYYNEADRGDYSCIIHEEGGLPFQVSAVPFLGLHQSIEYIAALWHDKGPFEGLLAFSQGAGMASMIAKLAETDGRFASLQYAILVSGFWLEAAGEAWYSGDIKVPSLHVMGSADTLVPEPVNRQLAAHYPAAQIFLHPGGHVIPQNASDIATYLQFIEQCTGPKAVP